MTQAERKLIFFTTLEKVWSVQGSIGQGQFLAVWESVGGFGYTCMAQRWVAPPTHGTPRGGGGGAGGGSSISNNASSTSISTI